MGRKGQGSGFMSRISYLLVVLASLLAFDFEPAGAAERIAPQSSYSLDIDTDESVPGPDDSGLAPASGPAPVLLARGDTAADDICNDPKLPAQWSYHFLVRGPPSVNS